DEADRQEPRLAHEEVFPLLERVVAEPGTRAVDHHEAQSRKRGRGEEQPRIHGTRGGAIMVAGAVLFAIFGHVVRLGNRAFVRQKSAIPPIFRGRRHRYTAATVESRRPRTKGWRPWRGCHSSVMGRQSCWRSSEDLRAASATSRGPGRTCNSGRGARVR